MNLKELREKHSLTQAALAKELGVTSKTISLIESGKLKLSEKLGAKIKEVYGEEPNAPVAEAVNPVKKARGTKKKEKVAAVEKAEAAAEAVVETEKKVEKRGRKARAKADKPTAEAVVAPVEAAAATVEAAGAEKKTKKAAAKRKAPAAWKPRAAKAAPVVILQSPFGGEITADEILSKIGEADKVYVRLDQNKAYWVKGEETGDVDLW